jgi:hypothetical protein
MQNILHMKKEKPKDHNIITLLKSITMLRGTDNIPEYFHVHHECGECCQSQKTLLWI